MRTRPANLIAAASLGILGLVAGCSGADRSEPTAPVSTAGATANGTAGSSSSDGAKTGSTGATSGFLIVTGTISALAGTCPALAFKLETKAVKTDAATVFAEVRCADLTNGTKVGVSGTVQGDGVLLAKALKVMPATPPVIAPPAAPVPPPATAVGTVSALTGACPAITFKLDGKVVVTDAATIYGDKTCADVKNDLKAGALGIAQANGSILAKVVKLVPPPALLPPSPVLMGEVTAVSGTCPSLTISVGAKSAVTSASTVFEGKPCVDVRRGMKVGIYGTIAAGATTLSAIKVVVR